MFCKNGRKGAAIAAALLSLTRVFGAEPPDSSNAAPRIISVIDGEGKSVPYGKIYGDFDKAPQQVAVVPAYYPKDLLKRDVQGAASVEFVVSTSGRVRDLKLQATSAHEFGDAALEAASHNRYLPATKNGKKVECKIILLYTFPGPWVIGKATPQEGSKVQIKPPNESPEPPSPSKGGSA